MTEQQALYNYCIHLGDNALIQSYRLSEWCSNAPILEEDLALTNMALDMTGRAQLLLQYAGTLAGKGLTSDDLAYRRNEPEYRNDLITELPDADFAFAMVKQMFVSTFEYFLYSALKASTDSNIASIAAKSVKEAQYHMAHTTDWVVRLGDGTDESNRRAQEAVDALWPYTAELFETDDTEAMLTAKGIAAELPLIHTRWQNYITGTMLAARLELPANAYHHTGGRKGIHTEYLGHILTEMQYLQRAYPDATW